MAIKWGSCRKPMLGTYKVFNNCQPVFSMSVMVLANVCFRVPPTQFSVPWGRGFVWLVMFGWLIF